MKRALILVPFLFLAGCVWPWQKVYMPNGTFLQAKPAVQAAKESSAYYSAHEKEFTSDQRATFAKNNANAWDSMGRLFDLGSTNVK